MPYQKVSDARRAIKDEAKAVQVKKRDQENIMRGYSKPAATKRGFQPGGKGFGR
jgi:hypothetical protein